MLLYSSVRWVHIALGAIGFACLWVPLVTRKGSPLHRSTGWTYVVAMLGVAASGMVLSLLQVARAWPAPRPFSWFLAYVGLMSAAAAIAGVRVLRFKSRTTPHRHPGDLALPALVLAGALALAGYGLYTRTVLLVAFAPVGLVASGGQLAYWLRAPRERAHWWFEHMGQMLGSGIGTLTAFLVINVRHLGGQSSAVVWWLAPTVVGVVGGRLWARDYRQRFASGRTPARSPVPA